MRKKILVVILAFSMVFFAACGKDKDDTAEPTDSSISSSDLASDSSSSESTSSDVVSSETDSKTEDVNTGEESSSKTPPAPTSIESMEITIQKVVEGKEEEQIFTITDIEQKKIVVDIINKFYVTLDKSEDYVSAETNWLVLNVQRGNRNYKANIFEEQALVHTQQIGGKDIVISWYPFTEEEYNVLLGLCQG